MKKGLATLMILCILCCFCASVSAAPGGTYRIEETGMSLDIPTDWTVFTRDASLNDPDIKGYGIYDQLMEDLTEGQIY